MPIASFFRTASRPIRSRLFRDLVLLVLFTVGLLALVAWGLIGALNRDLAATRISDATRMAREEVRNFVQPLSRQLLIARDGLTLAGAEALTPTQLTGRFLPILRHLEQIAGALLADEDGGEYFLRRAGEQWLVRTRDPRQPGRVTLTRLDTAGAPVETWEEPLAYDPRQRPWYAAAREAQGQVGWSEPYKFQALDLPGITATLSWELADKTRVLAFDLLLDDLLAFLRTLPLSTLGTAFLVDADGGVYHGTVPPPAPSSSPSSSPSSPSTNGATADGANGANGGAADGTANRRDAAGHTPENERPSRDFQANGSHEVVDDGLAGREDRQPFFSAEEHFGGPQVLAATAAWRAAGRPNEGQIRFTSGDRAWLAAFLPLTANPEGGWIGVTLPQSLPGDALASRWPVLLLVTLVIVGLGAALAGLVIRKYSRQLKDLPRLSIDYAHPEADLYDLIGRGEDAHLEFKSTMRHNLRTGKAGKEIELAWLKGVTAFLNTDGGIVLLGVADDGTLLGLEADGFENDDKCRLHFKNLLNQHLGPEYARLVRFELYQLEGKSMGAVECERSSTPVFLRAKNNEEAFLIRTGPSNIELSLSRALKYIQERA